ncbi:MAG: fumarate hydratase [Omnitrophica WOR_2 bacterium RIFCSPLOWO2_01_FULL_41_12]|nr:MAG: fumarate hydratase [Omnitrophica WOR_2 bacterium RIFCSPLOWO2_01_FULL_41_12]
MKIISAAQITKGVSDLCIQANLILRQDVLTALKKAYKGETNKRAKEILDAIISNAFIAQKEKLAICQDTGLPCVFVELGQEVKINGDLNSAINKGIESGYRKGFLRNSIVKDPLFRGKSGYQPVIIHIDIVKGNKLKLTVLPKGFGCENKTQLKMFNPTAKIDEIKKFIIGAVKSAGPDACPPYIVGVGIGGSADYACLLAKKALLRKIRRKGLSPKGTVPELERGLLSEINRLNIGPMGLGGRTTCLGVNIETYPTHIAGLPVCVNISCHALRSATKVI